MKGDLQPPDFVLQRHQLEHRKDLWGNWEPHGNIRWSVTDANLYAPHAHDYKRTAIEECLIQYRLNCLNEVEIRGRNLLGLLDTAAEGDKGMRVDEYVAERLQIPVEDVIVDDGASPLMNAVNIQAIYHRDFVAIPHEWECQRSQVFEPYEPVEHALVLRNSVRDVVAGRLFFTTLKDVVCPRITYYATPFCAVWQVGDHTFWVPPTSHFNDEKLAKSRREANLRFLVKPYELPTLYRKEIPKVTNRSQRIDRVVAQSMVVEIDWSDVSIVRR